MNQEHNSLYPSTDEIDPQQAIFLYEKHCAIIIIEDITPGMEFGFDLFSDRVGEKFKGIKLIPPGIHFVYASAADKKSLHSGPRSGFFYNFREREVLIKRWSSSEEDFDDSYKPTDEQIERYASNLRDLDRYLSCYKFSTYRDYIGLTRELTIDTLNALHPECNRIRSVPYNVRQDTSLNTAQTSSTSRTNLSTASHHDFLPELKPDIRTVIHFTNLLAKHQPPSSNPNEVTAYNLDSTTRLDQIFPGESGRERMIQEFQFAFITFLLCHVYDSFEHWKGILSLVCRADSALGKYPNIFIRFIKSLKQQLQHVPEDLFDGIVDDRNLVRTLLDGFFQNLETLNNQELNKLATDLKLFVQEKFSWPFDIELEDEQPVVVELA